MAAQRVAVIGAGIGGLSLALELTGGPFEVVLVERDPPPPELAPEQAFEAWARPGVPQFRHAHIFLSRLRTALRDRHPELLAELLAAGFELSTLPEVLPAGVADTATPEPGDDDLLHLWGRRATFEYVLRRHVGRLPHVRFLHETKAVGLLTRDEGGALRVYGLELKTRDDAHQTLEAAIVVDASGKRSKSAEWLRALGVGVEVERHESGFVYACRHYQLAHPENAPPRRDGGGNLDYLGYSLFYEEHGCYALTFGVPEDEPELTTALHDARGFEALARQFPVIRRWREASAPITKVLGAGSFENRWTRYGHGGGRALRGYFALGDAHLETNPMYGRGCASAFVQAEVLADALRTLPEAKRTEHYARETRRLLQPYYQISVSTDRMYHVRANLRRGRALPLGERLLSYLYESAFLPATHTSLLVAREFLRSVQMREISRLSVRVAMSWQILLALLRTWLGRRVPQVVSPPPREQFLQQLAAAEREDQP